MNLLKIHAKPSATDLQCMCACSHFACGIYDFFFVAIVNQSTGGGGGGGLKGGLTYKIPSCKYIKVI